MPRPLCVGILISAWFDDPSLFCLGVAVGSLSTFGMVTYRGAVVLALLVDDIGSLWLANVGVCIDVVKSLTTHWDKLSGLGKMVFADDVVIGDSFPIELPSETMFLLTDLLNIGVPDETLFMWAC